MPFCDFLLTLPGLIRTLLAWHSLPMALDATLTARSYRHVWRVARVALAVPLLIGLGTVTILLGRVIRGDNFMDGAASLEFRGAALALFLAWQALTVFGFLSTGSYTGWRCCMLMAGGLGSTAWLATIFGSSFLNDGFERTLTNGVYLPILILTVASSVVLAWAIGPMVRLQWGGVSEVAISPFRLSAAFRRLVRARRVTYSTLKRIWWVMAAGAVTVFALAVAAEQYVAFLLLDALATATGLADIDPESMKSFGDAAASHPWAFVALNAGGLLSYACIAALAMGTYRGASRLMQRSADDLIRSGTYAPIVFLRSFQDETARVRPIGYFRRLMRSWPRLEEVVVNTVARMGPPIAIGLPGERLPRIGAMRAYYTDDSWQAAFHDWVRRAHLIVVMAGSTPWSLWELDYLLTQGWASKTLLVVPSGDDTAALSARWDHVVEAAQRSAWGPAMRALNPHDLRALVFLNGGRISVVTNTDADQVGYELAVRFALVELEQERAATHSRSMVRKSWIDRRSQ